MVKSVPDLVDRPRARTGPADPHASERELVTGAPAAVADALAALPAGWSVREDVRRRGSRFAGIDHVVIGPSGIFVIDVRDWSGSVTVVDNVVRHDREVREDDTDRCADAARAVAEVVEAVDGYAEWLLPVLCVARDEPLLDWAVEVRVCSTATLVEALTSLPPVLSPQLVTEALTALGGDAVDEAVAASTVDAPTVPDVPVVPSLPEPPTESRPDRAEINARLNAAHDVPAPEPEPRRPSRREARAAARAAAAASAATTTPDVASAASPAAAPKAPRRLLRRASTGFVGIAVAALLVTGGPQMLTSVRSAITELDGTPGTCLPSGESGTEVNVRGTTGGGTSATKPGTKAAQGADAKPRSKASRLAAAEQRRADRRTQALDDLPPC